MRAYQTIKFEEYPDVGDIQGDGRKSSIGKLKGDEKGFIRNPKSKAEIRQSICRSKQF